MFDGLIEYFLVHYRWVFVIYFLLPLSTLYDVFAYFRCKINFKLFSNPQYHDKRVQEVQRQVRKWKDSGAKHHMCTGRPGWQTMSFRKGLYKHSLRQIHINLMDILKVDTEKKIVRVEPLVTMGQVTAVLNQLGWTLPILPELDDLTVGGLIMGTGVETSSHKYGLFQHICEAFELVLADGRLVRCTKEEERDLFYAVPWSHGTLGFLVAAELRIVPAKRYVRIDYIPAHSNEEMIKIFSEEVNKKEGNDFVEGLAFSRESAVIMTANMTDDYEKGKLNEIGKFYKPWFFSHVQRFLRKGRTTEYIPLRDYYHRHSRSLFWQIRDIIPFGNNIIFRWLLGWMVPPKVSFLKITQTKAITKFYERHEFIQDILVPLNKLKESIAFFDEKLKIYPLWLCPFNLFADPGMVHPQGHQPEMYVDVGVYGIPADIKSYHPENTTREVEAFARSINGFQMLYADSYQTKEEFRQMFDHTLYDRMRDVLNCHNAFPDVYDKIKKSARY